MTISIISHAVGDWKKAPKSGPYNRTDDILSVQYMLYKVTYYKMVEGVNYTTTPNGIINQDAAKSETVKALCRLQGIAGAVKDGEVKPNDRTMNYLVEKSWIEQDQKLKNTVIEAIADYDWSIAFVDNLEAPYAISPLTFMQTLAPKIKNGSVRVMLIPDNADTKAAHYLFGQNILGIEQSHATSKPIMIHEAAHALQDICKRKFARPWEEVAPYLAQNYYRYKKIKNAPFVSDRGKALLKVIKALDAIKTVEGRVINKKFPGIQEVYDNLGAHYLDLEGEDIVGSG